MVQMLQEGGHEVVVADNLSTGYRNAVPTECLEVVDLADREGLERLFARSRFDGVMHFASFIQVGESVTAPAKYYANNVANTLNLLDAMVSAGVRHFIFSSSAAVYGEPQYVPLDEAHPCAPINPYGRSKWMVEQILADYDRAYGLNSVSLRYFNAAGAITRLTTAPVSATISISSICAVRIWRPCSSWRRVPIARPTTWGTATGFRSSR